MLPLEQLQLSNDYCSLLAVLQLAPTTYRTVTRSVVNIEYYWNLETIRTTTALSSLKSNVPHDAWGLKSIGCTSSSDRELREERGEDAPL